MRRVLEVCCVDAARVPADVVDAHIELTTRLDRRQADDAYLRSARSLSLMMAYPGETMRRLGTVIASPPCCSTAPATCWCRCRPPAG